MLVFDDSYPATSSSHPLSILAPVKLSKLNPKLPLPPNYFFGDDEVEESFDFVGAFYSRICFNFNAKIQLSDEHSRAAYGAGDLDIKTSIVSADVSSTTHETSIYSLFGAGFHSSLPPQDTLHPNRNANLLSLLTQMVQHCGSQSRALCQKS